MNACRVTSIPRSRRAARKRDFADHDVPSHEYDNRRRFSHRRLLADYPLAKFKMETAMRGRRSPDGGGLEGTTPRWFPERCSRGCTRLEQGAFPQPEHVCRFHATESSDGCDDDPLASSLRSR